MARTWKCLVCAVAIASLPVTSSSGREARSQARFSASAVRHEEGTPVTFRLVNGTSRTVVMGKYWSVTDEAGNQAAFYQWPDDQLEIAAGDFREWRWDQLAPRCYGECQNVSAGDQTPAGKYTVSTSIDSKNVSDTFTIGSYFTLGFDGEPDLNFVVFVATQPEIDSMREQANSEDKNLIVSGIVRGAANYNPEWSYRMGSHSIVLGEVFTEVCDANPHYVEHHLSNWKGQRWCPWSSYVAKEGR